MASNPAYVAPASADASYAHDGLNRMTSAAGGSVSHDANQNITAALGNSYGYDAANRLTSATIGGSGNTYAYDPAGRLYEANTVRFLYAGQQLAGEIDGAGVMALRHVPGPGLDEPVATRWATDTLQQITDERGSVIAAVNGSGVATINRYDEYGVSAAGHRFQYTGQTYMAPGLYNYRARAYAPELGRFLQTDPIGYQAGANLYGYVGADPINLVDPSGLQEICWSEIIGQEQTTDENGDPIYTYIYRGECFDLGELYKWMNSSLDSLTRLGQGFAGCNVPRVRFDVGGSAGAFVGPLGQFFGAGGSITVPLVPGAGGVPQVGVYANNTRVVGAGAYAGAGLDFGFEILDRPNRGGGSTELEDVAVGGAGWGLGGSGAVTRNGLSSSSSKIGPDIGGGIYGGYGDVEGSRSYAGMPRMGSATYRATTPAYGCS